MATGEPHHPAVFIFERQSPEDAANNEQRVAIIPVPLEDLESKDRAFSLIHAMAQHEQVEGVIFVVESWIKAVDKADDHDRTKSLEHDPERSEIILFNAQSGAMQLIAYCAIERPANTLGEPLFIDPMGEREGATGRMIYDKPHRH